MEASLHSLLPLNIIYGEPLKSGCMDLIDAHVDEPCEKSCEYSPAHGKAELMYLVEVTGSCMYSPATHNFYHMDSLSRLNHLHVENLSRVDLLCVEGIMISVEFNSPSL